MRSLTLLLTALLLTTAAFAQQRFVPATVFLPKGDSLIGEIDYRKWDKDPLTISFRGNGSATAYTPEMLAGFRIHENDEQYISVSGEMDITYESTENLSVEKTRVVSKGPHFFRVVMNGPVKLLQHTDKNNRQHFVVQTPDTTLHLIRQVKYIDNHESANYGKVQTLNFFRQQLDILLNDCNHKSQIDALEYRAEALSRVLQRYTACKYPTQQAVIAKKDPQMRAMYGVMGGASFQMVTADGPHPVAKNKFKHTFTPTVGVFLDLPLSRRRQQLVLNMEGVYSSKQLISKGPDPIDFTLHFLSLQTLLRYTYPVGELRPYVNGGFGIMAKISGSDLYRREGRTQQEEALGGGRELTLPIIIGAGLRYKRLNGELRYILPHALDVYNTLDVRASTAQLLIRYVLRQ
ncbi:hypothetical protein [Chitinophaga deserti]|uniref:hypothetical protein n=1 Tax=Chitinophaga deserti TaxID=2164099 RepID=UPI00130043A0|nr:hypothetical protein [Chitinophaga deserti]